MAEYDDLLFALSKVAIKDAIVSKHKGPGNHPDGSPQKIHGKKKPRKAPPPKQGIDWAKLGFKNDDDLSWQEGAAIGIGGALLGGALAIGGIKFKAWNAGGHWGRTPDTNGERWLRDLKGMAERQAELPGFKTHEAHKELLDFVQGNEGTNQGLGNLLSAAGVGEKVDADLIAFSDKYGINRLAPRQDQILSLHKAKVVSIRKHLGEYLAAHPAGAKIPDINLPKGFHEVIDEVYLESDEIDAVVDQGIALISQHDPGLAKLLSEQDPDKVFDAFGLAYSDDQLVGGLQGIFGGQADFVRAHPAAKAIMHEAPGIDRDALDDLIAASDWWSDTYEGKDAVRAFDALNDPSRVPPPVQMLLGAIDRVEPGAPELLRGMTLPEAEIDRLSALVMEAGTSAEFEMPISSFTTNAEFADHYAKIVWTPNSKIPQQYFSTQTMMQATDRVPVVVKLKGGGKALNIGGLTTNVAQNEWLSEGRFRYSSISQKFLNEARTEWHWVIEIEQVLDDVTKRRVVKINARDFSLFRQLAMPLPKREEIKKHGNHDQKTHGRKGPTKFNLKSQERNQAHEPGSFWAKYGIKNDDKLSWQEGTLLATGVLVGAGAGLAIGMNSQRIAQAYDDFFRFGVNTEGALASSLIEPVVSPMSTAATVKRLEDLTTAGHWEAGALHQVFDGVDLGGGYSTKATLRGLTGGWDDWEPGKALDTIEIQGDIMKGDAYAGHFSRIFHVKTGVMDHTMLIMGSGHQTSGAGNALFKHSIAEYKKLGFVDEVEVHTAWIGGYNWARAGYQFENGVMPKSMVDNLKAQLGNTKNDRRIKEEISTILTRHEAGEVVTPQDIAAIGKQYTREVWRPGKPRIKMWAGKSMMIGQSWNGRLPITPKGEAALAGRTAASLSASAKGSEWVRRAPTVELAAAKANLLQNNSVQESKDFVASYQRNGFIPNRRGYWEPPPDVIEGEIVKHLIGRHNQQTHARRDHKKHESYLLNQDVKRWLTDEHEGGPVGSGIAYIRDAYERQKTRTALGRLFDAKAKPTEGILYRGIATNDPAMRQPGQVLAFGLSSFSSDPKVAFEFARKRAKDGQQAAVIRMGPGARGLDISPLYNFKTDTFRLHRRKKEYIVKDKARVLHSYKSKGITIIEVKPTAKRKQQQ